MPQKIHRIAAILKTLFIIIAGCFIIWSCVTAMPYPAGKQSFDMKSSIIISVGSGASFGMLFDSRKKR